VQFERAITRRLIYESLRFIFFALANFRLRFFLFHLIFPRLELARVQILLWALPSYLAWASEHIGIE
jgi:hypothetical protein